MFIMMLYTVKSQVVDRSTIQFWTPLVKETYVSIKFPLHKQSKNPKMCYWSRQSTARNFMVGSMYFCGFFQVLSLKYQYQESRCQYLIHKYRSPFKLSIIWTKKKSKQCVGICQPLNINHFPSKKYLCLLYLWILLLD